MSSTLRSILSIDKRIILLPIMLAVCDCDFNVFTFQMNNGIPDSFTGGFTIEQIKQAIFGMKNAAVIFYPQSCIEPCVVPQLLLYKFILIIKILEDGLIR